LGGYGAIVEHLVRALPPSHVSLATNTVVDQIDWHRGGVLIRGSSPASFAVRARHAIVTVPLGVWQAGPH
jgi:phytoene dehydrogenase-like protein